MARGPFIPIPFCSKIAVEGHDATLNRPKVVTMHALVTSTPSASNLTDIANAVLSAISSNHNHLPSDWVVDGCTVTDLNSSTGPQVFVAYSGTQPAGNNVGPGATAVTELHTLLRGRSYKGRIQWPCEGNDYLYTNGQLSPTGQAAVDALVTNIMSNLAALSPTSVLQVASRKLAQAHEVTSHNTRPQVGNIRRRVFG